MIAAITITFAGWWIPAIITVIAFGWAIWGVDDGSGMFSGLGNLVAMVPASIISMIAWIIYAILK